MTLQPDRLPTRFTHHVWHDQPTSHRVALAVCGFMMARAESVPDPTCPVCRAMLAEHERRLVTAMEPAS